MELYHIWSENMVKAMDSYYMSFFTFLTLFVVGLHCSTLDNGFGSEINWMTFDDGLLAAKEQGKLTMLIIHKSWCAACKAFKPIFASSKQILNLSQKFIMINVEDEDEPRDKKYSPDGKYIPRILFLDSNGDVMMDIFNKRGNPGYKYYYSDADSVLASMKDSLDRNNLYTRDEF